MLNYVKITVFLSGVMFFMGFSTAEQATSLEGSWIRKGDNLMIQIRKEEERFFSYIIGEGREKFPCEVSKYPIYKNILPAGKNSWNCEFLVVEMGSCETDYEGGKARILKNGQLEITCPGFSKKLYSRMSPRYSPKNL